MSQVTLGEQRTQQLGHSHNAIRLVFVRHIWCNFYRWRCPACGERNTQVTYEREPNQPEVDGICTDPLCSSCNQQ